MRNPHRPDPRFLTLFVDASFCQRTQAAGYGAWAKKAAFAKGLIFERLRVGYNDTTTSNVLRMLAPEPFAADGHFKRPHPAAAAIRPETTVKLQPFVALSIFRLYLSSNSHYPPWQARFVLQAGRIPPRRATFQANSHFSYY